MYTSGMPPVREPLRLAIGAEGRHAASPLAGVKVTSWLVNVWHLQGAQQRGFDEIILLNERGEIAECTAANIFCVKKGRVLTPPLSSGSLEGVTRSVLLEIAPQDGVPMEEATLRPEDLYAADEVFITSTNRNVIGIGEIEGHTFPSAPGPIVKKLESDVFSLHDRLRHKRRQPNPISTIAQVVRDDCRCTCGCPILANFARVGPDGSKLQPPRRYLEPMLTIM